MPVTVTTEALVVVLVGAAADMDVVSCRYVKGTSTKGISVVKKYGSLLEVVEDTSLTVNDRALVAGAALVSDDFDVALVVDVFTDVASVADLVLVVVFTVVFTDAALASDVVDMALVAGTGGKAAADTDETQKSAPVPHLPLVEHYRYSQSRLRDQIRYW